MTTDEHMRLRDGAVKEDIDLSYYILLIKEYNIASEDESVIRKCTRFFKDMNAAIQNIVGIKLSGIIYGSWAATLPEEITDKSP